MTALIVALLLVVLIDQSVKLLLWRRLRSHAAPPPSLRGLRVIPARLWLASVERGSSLRMMWGVWALLAFTLVVVSAWLPSSGLFVSVLLGGALSTELVSSIRRGSTA